MTYKKIVKIPSDHKLTIQLPNTFKENQKALISVDEIPEDDIRIALMHEAVSDPLFISDLYEINKDFDMFENESL